MSLKDPPPEYSPAPPAPSSPGPSATPVPDDAISDLSTFDTVFLIDDSGSMSEAAVTKSAVKKSSGSSLKFWSKKQRPADLNDRDTRWDKVRKVLAEIAPLCALRDTDGIDIYFLNHKPSPYHPHSIESPQQQQHQGKHPSGYIGVRDAATVEEIFARTEPHHGTPTARRLQDILQAYVDHFCAALRAQQSSQRNAYNTGVKPLNVIMITDGDANSPEEVEDVIVSIAEQLSAVNAPRHQVGVQFFRVGDDKNSIKQLKHLDDNLRKKHGVRDMVDTTELRDDGTLSKDGVMKAVMGGVNAPLDNAKAK